MIYFTADWHKIVYHVLKGGEFKMGQIYFTSDWH